MIRRDKVKVLPNVPMRLVIQTPWGKECTSQYAPGGVEWRFEVLFENREAYIYLPAEPKDLIHELRPNAGDVIELTMHKQVQQKDGFLRWTVVPGSGIAYPKPAQTENVRTMPAPAAYATQGNAALAPAPAPAPAPVATTFPIEEVYGRALMMSARAHAQAFRWCQQNGIEIDPPTWEDVRASANTLFIERQKNGGGR